MAGLRICSLEPSEYILDLKKFVCDGPLSEMQAVKLIRPISGVAHHPVSSIVNDVKNKSEACMTPIEIE
jgi:hypothetical protein